MYAHTWKFPVTIQTYFAFYKNPFLKCQVGKDQLERVKRVQAVKKKTGLFDNLYKNKLMETAYLQEQIILITSDFYSFLREERNS